MGRWLKLGAAAIALAAIFAGCAGEEDQAGRTATPARTATPGATAAVQATGTGTTRPSDRIPTVAAPVVTPRLSTATATARPATPTPPPPTPTAAAPTPQARQPEWTVSQVPSGTQVDIVLEDGLNNTYTIATVDPQWTQLESWDIDFVADLNADGIVEAIAGHYTGGAHCCFEYLIFSETPSGIQLDDWFSLTNGAIGTIEDLDGDGVPELDGSDDRFAYFTDLGFVGTPFLPLVLCRSADGTYSDCTTRFPQKLQESADGFEGHLRDAVQRQAEEIEKRYAALGLLASYMRMGMDDEGWNKVASLCPECEDWLMQNRDELDKRLAIVQPGPPGYPQ